MGIKVGQAMSHAITRSTASHTTTFTLPIFCTLSTRSLNCAFIWPYLPFGLLLSRLFPEL